LLADGRPQHEQTWAEARATLGETRFATAWAAGADLTLDEALAEATALARDVTASVPAGPGPGLAGLTVREQEILALLIDGRTDREIAAALFISQRTASNHVSAILHKLRVNTRAEAAVRAVRDGFAGSAA
jgi:DNA-binding NarL/FixJ family response regulator